MPEPEHPTAAETAPANLASPGLPAREPRTVLSRAAAVVAVLMLAGTFLLLSPPRETTYPGAIPWRDFSILRPLTELLSLGGLVATARGTEIKDLCFHLAAAVGLVLLAARLVLTRSRLPLRQQLTAPWLSAQVLLTGWVLLSALSVLWAGDAALARGQAALYALALAWAIALAWTLQRRHVPWLVAGLVAIAAAAALLCLWYYAERNPFHRPGFPLGNPGTLGATLLPAMLIALGVLAGAIERCWRARRLVLPAAAIGAAVALVPLAWCFWAAGSRSAMLGLAGGLATMLFLHTGRRVRWVLLAAIVVGAAGLGLWLMSSARLDAAMARGDTIRFRLYAWRYAAELWNQSWQSAMGGHGAGAYPRLAGQLSLRDRHLDPAAFMGEMVEHAHNELFEVLTEIGLVGGVTFVGGVLATLVAGGMLYRSRPRPQRRWLDLVLLAGIVALWTDSLFSPAMRLPGVPAVLFTLLGVLWAQCRAQTETPLAETIAALAEGPPGRTGEPPRYFGAAVLAGILALVAGWLTVQDWRGVLRESAASAAYRHEEFAPAVEAFEAAEARLLDPVRQIVCASFALYSRLGLARQAFAEFDRELGHASAAQTQPTSAISTPALTEAWRAALAAAQETHAAALRLNQRVPTLMHSAAVLASAAELTARLHEAAGSPQAGRWWEEAAAGWMAQRQWRPYDIEALLALTDPRYGQPLAYRLDLLRDALRATETYARWDTEWTLETIRRHWRDTLARLASEPGFADALSQSLAVVGPFSPQTDLDSLIAWGAPEVYRLAGYWEALRGNYAGARSHAAQAVRLYEPMRGRFPTLQSVAMLEEAEFTLRQSPEQARAAAELLRAAIERLPRIQEQKYEALLLPFRSWLALALLATGAENDAKAIIAAVVPEALLARTIADSYVRLAVLYLRIGPATAPAVAVPESALAGWLAAALRFRPDHPAAWYWTAWLARERGDDAEPILAAAGRAGVPAEELARMRQALVQEGPQSAPAGQP